MTLSRGTQHLPMSFCGVGREGCLSKLPITPLLSEATEEWSQSPGHFTRSPSAQVTSVPGPLNFITALSSAGLHL